MSTRSTREFKQRRSAATYEALLVASARVFGERGFDGAQTPEIAAAAGVSTGAFYRYFADKRQALLEVMAHHLERLHVDVTAELRPERFSGASDVRAAIGLAMDVVFEYIRRDAPLERVLMEMSLRDAEISQLRADFEAMAVQTLTDLIVQVIPAERVPNPRAAALVLVVSGIEIAIERAGLRSRSGPRVDDADVKRALCDMMYGYLFAPVEPVLQVAPARPAAGRPRRKAR